MRSGGPNSVRRSTIRRESGWSRGEDGSGRLNGLESAYGRQHPPGQASIPKSPVTQAREVFAVFVVFVSGSTSPTAATTRQAMPASTSPVEILERVR